MKVLEPWENFSLEDMEGEIWKDIKDYEGYYQVSNYGRVKSLERLVNSRNSTAIKGPKIIKAKLWSNISCGIAIRLTVNKVVASISLGKLVYRAFVTDFDNCRSIHMIHLDDNLYNNRVENLKIRTSDDYAVLNYFSSKPNKKCQYFGVTRRSNLMFCVAIKSNKKRVHLGLYKTELEAAQAYDNYILENNLKRKGNFIDNR